MGRMNVLYLADRNNEDHYYPLGPYIEQALHHLHDVRFLDPSQPVAAQIKGMDAVIDDGLIENTEQMVEAAMDLKLWQVAKTGFDDAPLAALKAKGIPTCNCPGVTSGISLAECAMMFILMLTRHYNGAACRLIRCAGAQLPCCYAHSEWPSLRLVPPMWNTSAEHLGMRAPIDFTAPRTWLISFSASPSADHVRADRPGRLGGPHSDAAPVATCADPSGPSEPTTWHRSHRSCLHPAGELP